MKKDKDYGWEKSKTTAHDELLPVVLKALQSQGLGKDSKFLDAGCGAGYILGRLSDAGYTNLWGFDLSVSGIELAKAEAPGRADTFAVHDVYVAGLPASFPTTYDAVLSIEVVEHLFDPKHYFQNINSWLNKGGVLVLSTPYHGYLKNLLLSLFDKWDDHHTVNWDIGHIKFFSKHTLSQMAEANGFKVVKFYGCGRIPFLRKSMMMVARKL